jgi:hypothetical protein
MGITELDGGQQVGTRLSFLDSEATEEGGGGGGGEEEEEDDDDDDDDDEGEEVLLIQASLQPFTA